MNEQPLSLQRTEIPPGQVRVYFAPHVADALVQLEASGADRTDAIIAIDWPAGADLARAIAHATSALAGVALARWPDWYGERAPFVHPDVGVAAAADYDDRVVVRLGADRPALDRGWARKAAARCRQGEWPVLPGFPPVLQVRQLMLALGDQSPILLLALDREDVPPPELLCFAQTANWLARETGARVAAFVPGVYQGAPALDTIAYDAVQLGPASAATRPGAASLAAAPSATDAPATPGRAVRRSDSEAGVVRSGSSSVPGCATGGALRRPASARRKDEPLRLVVPPVLGRPHPCSPGEQVLAAWLAQDAELAPLFAFNQRVETAGGDTFVVDLLWRDGRLTVEVDGYGWHSSPHAFSADRHRDYRLLCAGYRTLRLPHDEVMDDPALQCEKIRDVVRAIVKEQER